MLGALSGIFGPIISGVSDYFKGKQELKKVKLEAEKKLIEAKAMAELAVSEAKLQMAKQGQVNDYNLDMMAMKNMEKSYKDEFLLALFSIPMILAFIPNYADVALKGFNVIAAMPDWYKYTFIGMIVVIYGMRGMLRDFINKKIFKPGK